MKKFFSFPKNSENSAKTDRQTSDVKDVNLSVNNHKSFLGMVYANKLAEVEIEKDKPDFPAGSIIVREKITATANKIPQTVIAMVKRKKGFSKETGDWEFFVLDGSDLKLKSRETKSDCSKCHIQAEKTDWVFRNYLK